CARRADGNPYWYFDVW
nr:immunoglobulin heavy chain junction region [Mus musculus]